METGQELVEHIDMVNKVASEYIKGNDPSAIAKSLGITRNRVVGLLDEWRYAAANNEAIRARAREALAGADKHYNHLISKAYEVIEDAEIQGSLNSKTTAIKLILDIESKRLDMLQKAGLLENKEIAEELLEMERRQEILTKIIKEVSGKCNSCKPEVARRLTEINPHQAVTFNES